MGRHRGGLPAMTALSRTIRPAGYFALSFGSIVGSGWILVMGDWLTAAGPGGTVVALLLGGLVMLGVAGCYAELACRMPGVGAEFLYATRALGPRAGFMVGWFASLFLVAVCAFEGIALSVLVQLLFPQLAGPPLYTVLGEDIHLGAVAVGLGGVAVIAWLNWSGVTMAVAAQKWISWAFIACALVLVVLGLAFGDVRNLSPLLPPKDGRSALFGLLWVFGLTAMFLTGFQAAVHAIEERHPDTSLRAVVAAMLGGLVAAIVFYVLITLSIASAAPWEGTAAAELPAADAFAQLVAGMPLREFVLVAAIISLLKTWNAVLLMASRMLYAQATAGVLPAALKAIHPTKRVPQRAILAVSLCSAVAVLAGRGAIIPIVNMCSLSVALIFIVMIRALHVTRLQSSAEPAVRLPGGGLMLACVGSAVGLQAMILLLDPWRTADTLPPPEMVMFGVWAVAGWFAYRRVVRISPQAAILADTKA